MGSLFESELFCPFLTTIDGLECWTYHRKLILSRFEYSFPH